MAGRIHSAPAGRAPDRARRRGHRARRTGQAGLDVAVADPWTHPGEFAALIRDMAERGWRAPSRVQVAIDDAGRITIGNGLHRAAAALALRWPTVSTEVAYRHHAWGRVKEAVRDLHDGEARLYQPIDHPDFSTWPTWRTDTAARVAAIAESPFVRPGDSGIDVGCNAGAITRGLARRGFSMHGVDPDSRAVAAARLLAQADGEESAATFSESFAICPREVDFVVCLSVLNHHATDGRTSEGHALFRRLVDLAPIVFTDCPSPGEPVGGDSAFTDPSEWIAWLAASEAPGAARVLAERGATLQRTIAVWKRA